MELFIVRHAIAEDRREGLPDADRKLTPKGKKRFAEVVRGLTSLGVSFEVVLSSPWKRAADTAEMLRPLVRRGVYADEALAASPEPRLLETIAAAGESVAVVGHDPWLPELLAWLVLGDRAKGPRFELKKGGIALLAGTVGPGTMQLRALLPPKVLRLA